MKVVFRSGFDRGATWGWFDVGPYGSSGHGHRDKLSLNVHAHGSMLLVDSGRFAYSGTDLSARLHVECVRCEVLCEECHSTVLLKRFRGAEAPCRE